VGRCETDGPGTVTLRDRPTWTRRWAFAPAVTCATTAGGVSLTYASQPIEWLLPNDAQYTVSYSENGLQQDSLDGPFPAEGDGEGTQTYGALLIAGASYPFHAAIRLATIVDGEVVYRSTLRASCAADGPTTSEVRNVPEPATAALAIAASSAIGALARRRAVRG
jgi:hypothetical protein